MNAHRSIHAEQSPDANARFLAAKTKAEASLRTPLRRYEKVKGFCISDKMLRQFMSLERAADERGVSRSMHDELVRPIPSLAGHPNALDFNAAERGRQMSKRIEQFCAQLRAKMLREDEQFLGEPDDYFTTPREPYGMGG